MLRVLAGDLRRYRLACSRGTGGGRAVDSGCRGQKSGNWRRGQAELTTSGSNKTALIPLREIERRFCLFLRKIDRDFRTLIEFAVDRNRSVMQFDDFLDDA